MIGTGGVGLNVVQGAVVAGASRIFAIDLLDNKLDYAGSFGATDLVNGSKGDPVQQVLDLTDGLGVDYVFEAIGNVRATEQAIQMSARGGTVTLVGMAPQKQAATLRSAPLRPERDADARLLLRLVPAEARLPALRGHGDEGDSSGSAT